MVLRVTERVSEPMPDTQAIAGEVENGVGIDFNAPGARPATRHEWPSCDFERNPSSHCLPAGHREGGSAVEDTECMERTLAQIYPAICSGETGEYTLEIQALTQTQRIARAQRESGSSANGVEMVVGEPACRWGLTGC